MGLPTNMLTCTSVNMILVRQKESDIAITLMNKLPDKALKLGL